MNLILLNESWSAYDQRERRRRQQERARRMLISLTAIILYELGLLCIGILAWAVLTH